MSGASLHSHSGMANLQRKDVDELKEAFKVFDKDGDGTISSKVRRLLWEVLHWPVFVPQEIAAVTKALGEDLDKETIDLMVKSVDTVRVAASPACFLTC